MAEQEGVIKYQLDYTHQDLTRSGLSEHITELNAWRSVLHRLALIGQDPARYDGYGFGNVSQRWCRPGDGYQPENGFVISGTQTGELETLTPAAYCHILAADPAQNRVQAEGLVRPSSEALTHATVYHQDMGIQVVMHVHSPDIWRCFVELDVPFTDASIAYGTPQMAQAVTNLFRTGAVQRKRIFAMAGHEDGMVTFGASVAEAGQVLVHYLALALALGR